MNSHLRRKEILNTLVNDGLVKVETLAKRFDVSNVTIRNDLAVLDKNNPRVTRFHGGAEYQSGDNLEDRKLTKPTIKSRIAKEASQYVSDGLSILLDNGSTVESLAEELLEYSELFILTNSLNAAHIVQKAPDVKLVVAGGLLKKSTGSMFGSESLELIKKHRFDILFLSADGVDIDIGLTTSSYSESVMNKEMCEVAKEVILLVDSSKFKRTSHCFICNIDKVSKIITDSDVDNATIDRLNKLGIETIICQ